MPSQYQLMSASPLPTTPRKLLPGLLQGVRSATMSETQSRFRSDASSVNQIKLIFSVILDTGQLTLAERRVCGTVVAVAEGLVSRRNRVSESGTSIFLRFSSYYYIPLCFYFFCRVEPVCLSIFPLSKKDQIILVGILESYGKDETSCQTYYLN